MATSPAHIRSLYRSLLRELPARPLLASPRSSLHAHLRASFASTNSNSESASASASHGRAEAEQVIAYLRSQRQYATLVERYNPGMDMEEEERVRLTARRVGMNLPVVHIPEGKK